MGIDYFDANGKEYHLGDLVYNPFFGDIWLVDKWRPEDKPGPEDSPYCFILYGDRDEYVMDIQDPDGFEIERRIGEDGYDELLRKCKEFAKKHKQN